MSEAALHGFEAIASGIYLEGLAVDHRNDTIWYSDVIAGGIHGVRPDGTPVGTFNEARMWTGGVLMNDDGAVLSSGEGGIMWNDPESGRSGWLVDTIDGEPINGVNEMVPDGTGGIFFGTLDIEMVIKGEAPRSTALYRLTAARELIKLADGLGFTNGLAFDAQRRRFYCNDTFNGTWGFDVAEDGTLQDKVRLLDKEDADGIALDARGIAWITGFRSGFFTRMASDGTILGRVDTPAGAITQLRFGGADARDCYFTAVPANGGDTLKEGGEMTERNSYLYRARAQEPGLRMAAASFKLR